MWIFLKDAMLSIVAIPGDPDRLCVRARAKGDIEAVFPGVRVQRTPARDYLYRAHLPRRIVADEIARRVLDNQATNFKASVREDDRHDAYSDVWGVMMRFQRRRAEPSNARQKPPVAKILTAPRKAAAIHATAKEKV